MILLKIILGFVCGAALTANTFRFYVKGLRDVRQHTDEQRQQLKYGLALVAHKVFAHADS